MLHLYHKTNFSDIEVQPRSSIELQYDPSGPVTLYFSSFFKPISIPHDHSCIGRLYHTRSKIEDASSFIEDIQIGIGGKKEKNESKEDALVRECQEESHELTVEEGTFITDKCSRYDVYDVLLGKKEKFIEPSTSTKNKRVWAMAHAKTEDIHDHYKNCSFANTYGETFEVIAVLDHILLDIISNKFEEKNIRPFDRTKFHSSESDDSILNTSTMYRCIAFTFSCPSASHSQLAWLRSCKQCPTIDENSIYKRMSSILR